MGVAVALWIVSQALGDAAVPDEVQAALFKKILSYDRSLSAEDTTVAILTGGDDQDVTELVRAFSKAGIGATPMRVKDLMRRDDLPHVVYLMPRAGGPEQRALFERRKILSISGEVSLVERGLVSVGLHLAGGHPEIVIHLQRLMSEQHELSAGLMNLAHVIR